MLGLRLSKCRCLESGLPILFLGLQHSKITTLTIESTNLGGYASDIVAASVRLSSNLSYIQLTDVNLEQHGNNVQIYAAGIMKVNRHVVPNLIIFDASGIAGTMAGKGTLWLNSYFDVRQQQQEQEQQRYQQQ